MKETLKALRQRIKEERVEMEKKRELYHVTAQIELERNQMANEEVISRYGFMEEEYDKSMQFFADNKRKLNEFDGM